MRKTSLLWLILLTSTVAAPTYVFAQSPPPLPAPHPSQQRPSWGWGGDGSKLGLPILPPDDPLPPSVCSTVAGSFPLLGVAPPGRTCYCTGLDGQNFVGTVK